MEEITRLFCAAATVTLREKDVDDASLAAIKDKAASFPGTTPLKLRIATNLGKTVTIELPDTVDASEEFFHEMGSIRGARATAALRAETYLDPANTRPRYNGQRRSHP